MKVYKSKISYALLIFISLLFLSIIMVEVFNQDKQASNFIGTTILILTYIFILYIFFSTKYIIDVGFLKIRSGILFKKDVKIQDIKSIYKTNSIMASPAASFDRLEIKFDKFDSVVISPENKVDFLNDLLEINPNIKSDVN